MTPNGKGNIRLLYIEDEKEIQKLIAEMMGFMGYEVQCADNGQLGVEKAKSWQPDVILTDVRMPVMDGPTAIRELRKDPQTANIPVFALTAYNDNETRSTCEEAGANGFFTKPPDLEKIVAIIQQTVKL